MMHGKRKADVKNNSLIALSIRLSYHFYLGGPDGPRSARYNGVEIIPPGTKPEDAIMILKFRRDEKSVFPDIK
jgi:hypothetical protein